MKKIPLSLFTLLLSPSLLFAQEQETSAQKVTESLTNFWEILAKGGPLMIGLGVLSFITVLLVAFYFLVLRKGAVTTKGFLSKTDHFIRERDFQNLLAFSARRGEATARILHRTLDFATKNTTANFEEVREVAEAEGSRQASILHQRITYLADIAAIAPMVGLLGTVLGMIESFNELSKTVNVLQTELSGGVAKALITTASGLVIGIVATIFYSFFRGKVQKLIAEMESATTYIMALLASQYKQALAQQKNQQNPSSKSLS